MTKSYAAKRRDFTAGASRPFASHVAWAVVCALLIATAMALWIQAQSLASQNASLKKQLAATAVPRAEPVTCRAGAAWQPGATTVHSVAGRQYLVHTPADFDNEKYYPLLLFYPGKGATPQMIQNAYGLDALPVIVAYPYPTTSTDGFPSWQGAPYSSGSDDVAFTQAVIDKTQDDLCIDRTKMYAAGMSNGGGFVSLLSCRMADQLAGFVVIAGAMYAPHDDCVPSRATPLLSVHGDKDASVPYAGSAIRRLPAIESWSAKRAQLNGCSARETSSQGLALEITTWSGCRDGAVVQSVRVVGGIHAWGDVTNDTIWNFLSRFSL